MKFIERSPHIILMTQYEVNTGPHSLSIYFCRVESGVWLHYLLLGMMPWLSGEQQKKKEIN